MRFYFIRHAQSADNQYVVENAHKGVRSTGPDQLYHNRQADPELSDIGRKQVERLGDFLTERREMSSDKAAHLDPYRDEFGLTHIYTSLMVRAMETAGAVGRARHLKPAIWQDLHETGGIWKPDPETGKPVGSRGKNRAYFQNRFPQFTLPDGLGEEGWWNRPVETAQECKDRAQRFAHDLRGRHGDTEASVALVSHGLFYSFMMNALLKIPSGSKVQFAMNNAAVTRIDFTGGYATVVYLNRSDHFPPDLIT